MSTFVSIISRMSEPVSNGSNSFFLARNEACFLEKWGEALCYYEVRFFEEVLHFSSGGLFTWFLHPFLALLPRMIDFLIGMWDFG